MKKIVVLLTCFVLGVGYLTGCAENDEALTRKSYTAENENITEVLIDVRDRQIEVALSEDNQIHLDYFENSKEYYDISVSDGHRLTMTSQSHKGWADYIGGKPAVGTRKILLRLPDAILTTLKLSTTNETISLPAVTVLDELSLSSQGGSLIFRQLHVGKSISLDAKNGDIAGTITGSYDDYAISCKVKKGESNLPSSKENGTKTLAVSNNNGDVDIAFVSNLP